MDIIEETKKFVEEECKKETSKYGYDPFPYHFVPVAKYAEELANKLGGNKEIILISAWLHDIGSIIEGREDHHLTGEKIAENFLKELNYPVEKIELIKKCIRNHRGSQENKRETIEEQIIAEADAMANFDNLPGILKAAFIYEGKNQEEARKSTKEKLERKWNQLHFEESKKTIRPKFEAVIVLLN
jgi:uncharacterized protein